MFDPASVQAFRFLSWAFDYDTGVARFEYAFDDVARFTETFRFPMPHEPLSAAQTTAFENTLMLLSLLAGISYYKAALPKVAVIESGSVTRAEVDALEEIYRNGLGEFAYVNRLHVSDRPVFDADLIDARDAVALEGAKGSLVAVGGGKDSCVTIELLRSRPITLAAINRMRPIVEVMASSDLPSLHVERTIDPALFDLNAQGAYNGHVPVTAIVSLALTALAVLHGFDAVVMSNERSASVGNTTWDGVEINHQWSKSLDAEALLAEMITRSVSPHIRYFSMLRPMSELEITSRFAKLDRYHDTFTSCNRAFRIDDTRRAARWCRDCPKCRFVFLALAPFMNPTRLAGIFGGDMLRDEAQTEGFDAVIGWNSFKPFECVGEVEESVAAFELLTQQRAWRDHELVRRYELQIRPEVILPTDLLSRPFELSHEHHIPPSFIGLINAA